MTIRARAASAVAGAVRPTLEIVEETLERDGRWLAAFFAITLATALIPCFVLSGWWSVGFSVLGALANVVVGARALKVVRRERIIR